MEGVGRLGADELNALYEVQIAALRSFEYPLFGLDPSWSGRRWCQPPSAAGVDGTRSRSVECALLHDQVDGPEGAYLRVATTTIRDHTMPWRLVVQVEPTPFEERIQAIVDDDYTPPGAHRRTTDILLDGSRVPFEVLSRGRYFVARRQVGPYDIVLQGEGFDLSDVLLVTVRDLEPYVEGFKSRH